MNAFKHLFTLGMRLGSNVGDLLQGHALPGIRRWFHRKWLCGPGLLAGNGACRRLPLLDGEERFAGETIEDEGEPLLGYLSHSRDGLPIPMKRHQIRLSRQVIVPDIMMNDLVVPDELSGCRVEGNQAITEEIFPFA